MDPNTKGSIGSTTSNNFNCSNANYGNSAIYLGNCKDIKSLLIYNNRISGNLLSGLLLSEISGERVLVRDNIIDDGFVGILASNILSTVAPIEIKKNIINENSIALWKGILINNISGAEIIENEIHEGVINGFGGAGIDLNSLSIKNKMLENKVFSSELNSMIFLGTPGLNSLCCNTVSGSGTGLSIFGTNTGSQIKKTQFLGSNMLLTQSEILDQRQHGNRWFGEQTEAELFANNILSAADNNRFFINTQQNSSLNGNIRPIQVLPLVIEDRWFRNIDGFSANCISPFDVNCGIQISTPFEEDESINNWNNLCASQLSIDSDNDGICDEDDMHPYDPYVPNEIDQDGDGYCDGMDPFPSDPCKPLSRDSDGDGICDKGDLYPLNPCLPAGMDSDGDGICDSFDRSIGAIEFPYIDLNNIDIVLDPNNEYFISSNNVRGIPNITIGELEKIALIENESNSIYERLNVWERKYSLLKVLMENHYYLSVSETLYNFWSEEKSRNDVYPFLSFKINSDYVGMIDDSIKIKLDVLDKLMDYQSLGLAYYTDNQDSAYIQIVEENLKEINLRMENIYNQIEISKNNYINELYTSLSNLVDSEPYQSKFKLFQKIRLSNINNDLSSEQIDALSNLAQLCPLEYGNSVYDAQALLLKNGIVLDVGSYSNCESNQIELRKLEDPEIDDRNKEFTSIHPNPTTGEVYIETNMNFGTIEIYNSVAKVAELEYRSQINLANLLPGIYFIRLSNEETSVTEKIIIQR